MYELTGTDWIDLTPMHSKDTKKYWKEAVAKTSPITSDKTLTQSKILTALTDIETVND